MAIRREGVSVVRVGELLAHHKRVNRTNEANTFEFADAALTLDGALLKYATADVASLSEDPENVRFRSTIEFPAFLLHVLKVWRGDDSADEGGLDDKKLIERFATEFDRRATEDSTLRGKVREFTSCCCAAGTTSTPTSSSGSSQQRTSTTATGRFSAWSRGRFRREGRRLRPDTSTPRRRPRSRLRTTAKSIPPPMTFS